MTRKIELMVAAGVMTAEQAERAQQKLAELAAEEGLRANVEIAPE